MSANNLGVTVIRVQPLKAHPSWYPPSTPDLYAVKINMGTLQEENWLKPLYCMSRLGPTLVFKGYDMFWRCWDEVPSELQALEVEMHARNGLFQDDAYWGKCFFVHHPEELLGQSIYLCHYPEGLRDHPNIVHEQPDYLGEPLCTFPTSLPDSWNEPCTQQDALRHSHHDGAWIIKANSQ